MDRRTLLASVGAAAFGAKALAQTPSLAKAGPPVARVQPVSEVIQGRTVVDPYRWLENTDDPTWRPWMLGQNAYARTRLDAIPGRDRLAARIAELDGKTVAVSQVEARGPYIFTFVRPAGADTFKLMVREGEGGPDRVLVDPDRLKTGTAHFSVDYWDASPDGRFVAYGVSPAGSEDSVLRFLQTATGKVMPESIDRAQFGAPNWAPDGSGVFYNRLAADAKKGTADYFLRSRVWFHRLGTDPATDVQVLGQGRDPGVVLSDVDTPFIATAPGSPVVLGIVANGVQNEAAAYVSPLADAIAGKPKWRKVCGREDNVTGLALRGPDLYLLSHQGAPRFKILKTDAAAPDLARATVIAPESTLVLKEITAARDGLYVHALDVGVGKLFRLGPDGAREPIALPFDGAVDGLFADPSRDGAWFFLQSWVKPSVLCRAEPGGRVVQTAIAPRPDVDVSPYTSVEVQAPARDGTLVPLSIVYRRDLKRDGSAPTLMEGYGAYAITIDPSFNPREIAWLELGGVIAYAHVRGGGENGEGWHMAGQKLTKPNTWRDMIDCGEYLIRERWTSSAKLAIQGTSAGGITVGRALTERPDLAAVAISRVGDSDALRSETMQSGPANIPEFGTVKEPDGFKGLYEMDAYQHVRDGVRYPAVLLTTGLSDPRVAPWEPAKMAARLQAATGSGKPVLLRVETDAGHGLGSTRAQRDAETADTYAFILWQTGDARFQPNA